MTLSTPKLAFVVSSMSALSHQSCSIHGGWRDLHMQLEKQITLH